MDKAFYHLDPHLEVFGDLLGRPVLSPIEDNDSIATDDFVNPSMPQDFNVIKYPVRPIPASPNRLIFFVVGLAFVEYNMPAATLNVDLAAYFIGHDFHYIVCRVHNNHYTIVNDTSQEESAGYDFT